MSHKITTLNESDSFFKKGNWFIVRKTPISQRFEQQIILLLKNFRVIKSIFCQIT